MVVYSASTPKNFWKDRQIQLAALYDTIVKILENIIKEIPEHLDIIGDEKKAVEEVTYIINDLKYRLNGEVNICPNIEVVMELIQNPFGDKVPKPFPINNLNELIDAHCLTDSSLNQANIDAIITATNQLKNFLSKQTSRQPQPSKEKDPVQSRQSQLPKENDPVQSRQSQLPKENDPVQSQPQPSKKEEPAQSRQSQLPKEKEPGQSRQPQLPKKEEPAQSRQSQLPKEKEPGQSQSPKNVSTQSPSLLTLPNGLSCAGGLVIGCILGTFGYGVLFSKKTTPVTATSSVRKSKKSQGPKKKTHKRIKP